MQRTQILNLDDCREQIRERGSLVWEHPWKTDVTRLARQKREFAFEGFKRVAKRAKDLNERLE